MKYQHDLCTRKRMTYLHIYQIQEGSGRLRYARDEGRYRHCSEKEMLKPSNMPDDRDSGRRPSVIPRGRNARIRHLDRCDERRISRSIGRRGAHPKKMSGNHGTEWKDLCIGRRSESWITVCLSHGPKDVWLLPSEERRNT